MAAPSRLLLRSVGSWGPQGLGARACTPLLLRRSLAKAAGPRVDEQALTLAQLRLICDQGKPMGIVLPQNALKLAQERSMQLKEVNPQAQPPVWRLFERKVEEQQQPRKSKDPRRIKRPAHKPPKVKELRLMDKCMDHDVDVKINAARGHLLKGMVVKLMVVNTGRKDDNGAMRSNAIAERFIEGCREAGSDGGISVSQRPTAKDGSIMGPRGEIGTVSTTLTPLKAAHEQDGEGDSAAAD